MKKNQKKYGYTQQEWNKLSPIRKLERKLDRVNHIMELIRTVVPVMLLLLNTIIILKFNKHENIFSKVFKDAKMIFWVGGSISFIIYVIVVWGFTKAPIPLVAALRETSIFFSIFIGYFFLKETINLKKIISIVLIVIGVIGIKLF